MGFLKKAEQPAAEAPSKDSPGHKENGQGGAAAQPKRQQQQPAEQEVIVVE